MKRSVLLAVAWALLAPALLVAQAPAGAGTKQDKKVAQEKVVGSPQTVTVPRAAAGHSATLNWTAPTTCVDGSACTPTGYKVYKASVACPASGLPAGATVLAAVTVTTYTDTSIAAPGTYCYYVTATNSAGESAASNTSGGSLAQPVISAPTNFTVTVN